MQVQVASICRLVAIYNERRSWISCIDKLTVPLDVKAHRGTYTNAIHASRVVCWICGQLHACLFAHLLTFTFIYKVIMRHVYYDMFKTCNCTSCFPKGLNSTFQNMNSFKVRELFPWGCFAQSSRLQSLLQQPDAQHQRGDRDGWDWMCWENLDATKINDFTNSLEFFSLGLANWCEWLSIHSESWVECEDVPFLRNYWLHGCKSERVLIPHQSCF